MNQFDFICFQLTSHSKVTIWRPTEERTPTSAKIHIDEMKYIDKCLFTAQKTLLIFPSVYFLREYLQKKECFILGIARTSSPDPLPPIWATFTTFFNVKKAALKR